MVKATLSATMVGKSFPEGTVDADAEFAITGTQATGEALSLSVTSAAGSAEFDLPPGSYTGVVSKLGYSSLPSAVLVVVAPVTVTLSVPDTTLPASLS